jgi:hypothetical protein
VVPPANPEAALRTPGSCSNAASRHQKQPPPRVAVAVLEGDGEGVGAAVMGIEKRENANEETRSRFLITGNLYQSMKKTS